MYNHLEEILEQKKQALLKHREESLFEEREWNQKVTELYAQIKEWFEPLQQKKYIVFQEEKRPAGTDVANEEDFKPAIKNFLTIKFFNGQTIEFKAVGLNIMGGYGRVDMQLGLRKIMIILKEPSGDWVFTERYSLEKTPTYDFNQDTFEQIVTEFVESF